MRLTALLFDPPTRAPYLPVQSAHESEEVNTFDKVTDVNGDPSG
jgi:hypothetical protein